MNESQVAIRITLDPNRVTRAEIHRVIVAAELRMTRRVGDATSLRFTTRSHFAVCRLPVVLDRFGSAVRVTTSVQA